MILKKVSLNQKSWLTNGDQAKTLTWRVGLVKRHQYGISVLISQMSYCKETSGGVEECCLQVELKSISQATLWLRLRLPLLPVTSVLISKQYPRQHWKLFHRYADSNI